MVYKAEIVPMATDPKIAYTQKDLSKSSSVASKACPAMKYTTTQVRKTLRDNIGVKYSITSPFSGFRLAQRALVLDFLLFIFLTPITHKSPVSKYFLQIGNRFPVLTIYA